MPPQATTCAHCRQTGFVRWEYVLQGGREVTQYYCGRCEYSWTIDGDESRRPTRTRRPLPGEKPDRSRP